MKILMKATMKIRNRIQNRIIPVPLDRIIPIILFVEKRKFLLFEETFSVTSRFDTKLFPRESFRSTSLFTRGVNSSTYLAREERRYSPKMFFLFARKLYLK